MRTFQSLTVSKAALLVVLSSLAQCTIFMHNGKAYDDKFHELFTNEAPINEIIQLAVNWNADKQLDHFDQLYHHINSNDKWAKYAQDIINATRGVLQRALNEVGYKKKMNLEQYLIGTYQIQNNMRNEVPPDVSEGIELLDKVDGDSFEKLLNRGSEEELEWELNNLHPYEAVPTLKKILKIVEGPIGPKPKKSDENPVSDPQKSKEKPVPDMHKSEEKLASESEESLSQSPESEYHEIEEQESKKQNSESKHQIPKSLKSEEIAQKVEETTKEPVNES